MATAMCAKTLEDSQQTTQMEPKTDQGIKHWPQKLKNKNHVILQYCTCNTHQHTPPALWE